MKDEKAASFLYFQIQKVGKRSLRVISFSDVQSSSITETTLSKTFFTVDHGRTGICRASLLRRVDFQKRPPDDGGVLGESRKNNMAAGPDGTGGKAFGSVPAWVVGRD